MAATDSYPTDGELAWEAYRATRKSPHTPWSQLPQDMRDSWEVAARAVRDRAERELY